MGTSESWSAQRDALAVEALRRSGRLRLQVRGESMLPTLWPGDVAEIAACSLSDVGRGEVVLARREGRSFLHRFLSRNHDGFITRGDSMPAPDPRFPSHALLGKVVNVLRGNEIVPLAARPWSRAFGFIVCHSSVARRAALKFHSTRRLNRSAVADLEMA